MCKPTCKLCILWIMLILLNIWLFSIYRYMENFPLHNSGRFYNIDGRLVSRYYLPWTLSQGMCLLYPLPMQVTPTLSFCVAELFFSIFPRMEKAINLERVFTKRCKHEFWHLCDFSKCGNLHVSFVFCELCWYCWHYGQYGHFSIYRYMENFSAS